MIVKAGRKFILKSKSTGKTLGVHGSKADAAAQETAINLSKAKAAGHRVYRSGGKTVVGKKRTA